MSEFNNKLRKHMVNYSERSGESFYRIAKNAKIPEQVIYSFRSGNAGLSSENAAKLANYINIELGDLI